MVRDLSAREVARLAGVGQHRVSPSLYLQVTPTGTRSWLFRYKVDGRTRWLGLGPVALVTLAEARAKALACRKQRLDGIDPLESKRAARAALLIERARAMTFRECAERYIAAHQAGWRNGKHRAQWASTLAAYVYPTIGGLPVQEIDTALVVRVLEPIWQARPETASRVRGRVESVLDWAKVRGYRSGENPARWRGHLDALLPSRAKLAPVEHHQAMAYAAVPAFMAELRRQEGAAARALELVILTTVRAGEALGARWSEVDREARTWTIPAERMKGGRTHAVPLGARALEVLAMLPRSSDLVLEGTRAGRAIGDKEMGRVLRRMGRAGLTVHGFRSAFRDWAAEQTGCPNHVVEMALAHAIGDKVEASYRRGDLLAKRRALMEDWDLYCATC